MGVRSPQHVRRGGAELLCAFWISYGALNAFYLSKIPAAEQNAASGLFLISWAVFSFYMWIASIRINLGVMLVFLTLCRPTCCWGWAR